jgi:glycosyltransferase involved in cell wall biosynthesis
MAMNVLMLSRDDVHTVPGGDTIQMLHTGKELQRLGVQIQMDSVSKAPPLSDIDLIHVFNWEQLNPFMNIYRKELKSEIPIVLSTIFWFHTGQWYDEAITSRPAWKIANAALGSSKSRILYEFWQAVKFRRGRKGQELRRDLFSPTRLMPNSLIEVEHLEQVLGLKGHLQNRCTIVPNGVIKELFDPFPEPDKEFYKRYELEGFVLEVARIQSAKNQLGLIEALSDITIPIVFIGQTSPYEKEYVERCMAAAKQRGNVYFLNPKTPQELAGIYRLAAVHVLPSWRETPGLASLEAAAAGCQIVTTSLGSAKEYFGDLAWYCNPRDPNSIRQAVQAALSSPHTDLLRKRILEFYTWEAAARVTLDVYQNILNPS